MPIDDVISKIVTATGLKESEIKSKIKTKIVSLDGLVTEEGAAYIVASEMGVKLFKGLEGGPIKIKNILSGMTNVDVFGKVVKINDIRTFTKNNNEGKVGSFVVGDETGTIRIVLWNEKANLLNKTINLGDLVRIRDAYTKDNSYTGVEVHVGVRSSIITNPEGFEEVSVSIDLPGTKSKKLNEISPGEQVSAVAVVVQTFVPHFYNTCPTCKRKVQEVGEGYVCNEHGETEAEPSMLFSFVLDDGSETVRSICFRNIAENISGLTVADAQDILAGAGLDELKSTIDRELLGKVIYVEGKVTENQSFGRTEMIINNANKKPSALAIAKALLNERE